MLNRVVLLISLIFTVQAWSFSLNGYSQLKGFQQDTISVHINPSNCPSDIHGDLDAAIDLWNATPTSNLKLKRGNDISDAVNISLTFSEDIAVGCSTNFSADTGGCDATCLNSVIGRATFTTNTNTEITRGVVVLNENAGAGAAYSGQSRTKRKVVLAHELGHALGLGHSSKEAALMNFSIGYKNHLNLAQDDIDGITYLYPGAIPLGCGTVATSTPPPPSSWWTSIFLIFMIPVMLTLWLRRPRWIQAI